MEIKPKAVLVNANNKGYCRVVLDSESLAFFLQNLSSIDDDLNRNYVWRILCDNLKIKVLKPQEFIQCVIDHIGKETEENTMMVVLQQVQWVLKYLIPLEKKAEEAMNLQLVLIDKLATNCPTKTMQILILQEIISYLHYDPSDSAY